MLKAKKKYTKKELKEDKFVIATMEAKNFIEDNLNQILTGLLALVVLIGGAFLWSSSSEESARQAVSALSQAQAQVTSGEMEVGKQALNDVVSNYGGTSAAGQATFMLANLYRNEGDNELAKTYFKKYVDDYSDENFLTQGAMAGYADCLMADGDYGQAASYYERAAGIEPDFPQAPSYLYSAAHAYSKAGNNARAEQLAQKIVDDYSDNRAVKSRAEYLLEILKQ